MPEVRLIDANALKDTISNIKLRVKNPEMMSGLVEMKAAALREVEAAPTITPEVRRGRWIPHGDDMWICSNCNENIIFSMHESDRTEKQRYCCRCGARMDGGADNG